MADSFWTTLIVGPYDESNNDHVQAVIEQLAEEYQYEGYDPVTTDDEGTLTVKFEIGLVKDGAARMFQPEGSIAALIDIGVPYVLYDEGHFGTRPGVDYSWHPSYGDTIQIGERNNQGDKVLSRGALAALKPRSNEELGKAVRAYFADVGSDAATAGWPIWSPDYTPQAIKARRVVIEAHRELPKAKDYDYTPNVAAVMAAVNADEPAVHLVGDVDGGYIAFGPYESNEHAIEQHDPELEEILTIFDRDLTDEDSLAGGDVTNENYGAIWCWGNLADGFSARGIYRDMTTAVDANDGQDGFVVALQGPLS